MFTADQLKKLPNLPASTDKLPNGKYVVPCHDEKATYGEGSDIVYEKWFQTPTLSTALIDRIQSIQLFAESHDQGFCDDELAGVWTWFELTILENEDAQEPKIQDKIELTWISHNNRFCEDQYGWVAGTKFPRSHDMLPLLEDGNVLAVRLCARFPGWEIAARNGYLVIEIGNPIEREHVDYSSIKDHIKSMQAVFQEVNGSLLPDSMQLPSPPDTIFQAEMLGSMNDRPLRVLSLDGGGVRGVAALMLLDAVMKKTAPGKKPCEVFDMIGGTSTGGFIAIMLGRLRMSIEDCVAQYKRFMKEVFPPDKSTLSKTAALAYYGAKWDATPLEDAIKTLLADQGLSNPEDVLLLDEESSEDCKVFVMATKKTGANNSAPAMFRSYRNPNEMSEFPSIKLWQAARATSAAPSYFVPLKIDDTHEFLDGGLQANNPLGWLWNEVLTVFGPARSTACFLSIGTGTPLATTFSDIGITKVVGIGNSLSAIATNSEVTNILFRSLLNAYAPNGMQKKYWRLNVGDGLPDWVEEDGVWQWKMLGVRKEEDIGDLDDVKAIGQTETRAAEYIESAGAQDMIGQAASALQTVQV